MNKETIDFLSKNSGYWYLIEEGVYLEIENGLWAVGGNFLEALNEVKRLDHILEEKEREDEENKNG